MPRKRSYTDDDFKEAVKNSFSIAKVLEHLKLQPTGGNYQVAKRRIKLLGLDSSHFTGKGHLKGKTHNWACKTPTEDILVEDSTYGGSTHSLKLRLIKEGFFTHKCYNCDRTEWMENKIPIELEHINGNRFDNRINNLTLLCPNCHALTPTYRGKNKTKAEKRKYERIKKYKCNECDKLLSQSKSGLCSTCCKTAQRKVERPSKNDLQKMVDELGYKGTGRKFGVSDNAIRKWLK